MANVKYFLAGREINPRNRSELSFLIDWENKEELTAGFSSLELANEDAQIVLDHIARGNAFEGIPLRIETDTFSLNLVADTVDNLNIQSCNLLSIGVYKEQGRDWLEEVAEAVTFRYLYSIGVIKDSDFVSVPYVRNFVPDNAELLILAVSAYTITKDINEQIRKLGELIGDLKNALFPLVTIGVTGPTVGPNTGGIIMLAINTVVQIAYTVAMAVALTKLIDQLIEQILPPKRAIFGMKVKTMFQKGLQHLGYTFKSSLIDSIGDIAILPTLEKKGPLAFIASSKRNGLPRSGSPVDNFADFINVMLTTFNADFRISNGEFRLEQKEYWQNTSSYTIPSTFIEQDGLSSPYRYNTSDIVSNYNISYLYDVQDENTLDNEGRVFQAITSVKTAQNSKLVKLKGLDTVAIPLALGVRKFELTLVERTMRGFLSILDLLAIAFGGTKPTIGIDGRLGSLSLSGHNTTVPKLVLLSGNKLASGQAFKIGAGSLWDNYHYTESFVPVNGRSNQKVIYENQNIPFCLHDLPRILDNPYCRTEKGERAEILSIEWNPEKENAVINYAVEYIYTNNLKITKL